MLGDAHGQARLLYAHRPQDIARHRAADIAQDGETPHCPWAPADVGPLDRHSLRHVAVGGNYYA